MEGGSVFGYVRVVALANIENEELCNNSITGNYYCYNVFHLRCSRGPWLVLIERNIYRIRHRKCSVKKGVLKIFCNVHRKITVLESLVNKAACFQACNFIKKILQRRCFPANIAKFLRTFFLKNIFEWLHLHLENVFV